MNKYILLSWHFLVSHANQWPGWKPHTDLIFWVTITITNS